jgi:hypothetical protein
VVEEDLDPPGQAGTPPGGRDVDDPLPGRGVIL